VNGVLIRDKERNWTNVIASQPIIQRIGDRFKRIDINDDSSDDVLWRDEK